MAGAGEQDGWRAGPRTAVRRHAERGAYDRATIEAILDEGFVCHLGYTADAGPVVVPTAYARVGDVLYLHGAAGNETLRTIADGRPVCVVVTLVDGLVLARSTFNHSINYRSAVVFGSAEEVRDPGEKWAALDAVVEHVVPGRTADARGPNQKELRTTRVLRVMIEQASAKIRTGGPSDDPADVESGGIWAGVLPIGPVPRAPAPDNGPEGPLPVPEYIADYRRPGMRRI